MQSLLLSYHHNSAFLSFQLHNPIHLWWWKTPQSVVIGLDQVLWASECSCIVWIPLMNTERTGNAFFCHMYFPLILSASFSLVALRGSVKCSCKVWIALMESKRTDRGSVLQFSTIRECSNFKDPLQNGVTDPFIGFFWSYLRYNHAPLLVRQPVCQNGAPT